MQNDLRERLLAYCDGIDGKNDLRVGLLMCRAIMQEAAEALKRPSVSGEGEYEAGENSGYADWQMAFEEAFEEMAEVEGPQDAIKRINALLDALKPPVGE